MALDLQLRAAFATSVRDAEAAGEAGGDPSHKLLLAQKGKKGLEVAFRLLRKARAQNNVPGEGDQLRSPELLVLAAEAAVKNGEFTSAREACHEFFLDGGGARDQFYCRALFVKALVVSNSIGRDGLVGAEAARRRSRAVGFLLQALDIASEGGARYAFLVHNASVHAWNVLRTALRAGQAGHHAEELVRLSDALEATMDADLRWRCTLLTAVSLALGDKGDASAASAKAALALQHAETLALREAETTDGARDVLNEAKERVAKAQVVIRRIEEAGNRVADGAFLGDGESEAGGTAEGSVISSSSAGGDGSAGWSQSLDTEEKIAAAMSAALASRATAEADAVEAGRRLTPLVKTAAEAAALAERAWLFRAYSAAEGAAAGGAEAKKLLETLHSETTGNARRAALLLQQQVTAGALTVDTVLEPLNSAAERLDPRGVTALAAIYARAAAGVDEEGGGGGAGEGEEEGEGGVRGLEEVLASLSAPSSEVQSVLADLGRTALKAMNVEAEKRNPLGPTRDSLLCFAKACHTRASASARSGNNESGGLSTSPASFRVRLEFLGAELAAQGMLSETSTCGGESGNRGQKLDARRTAALRLADRVEALKRVERSLLNCKRLGDPELLQILQELESPLARLRAQLHLEVAKCEVASDFLAKAAHHVEKASRQDYGKSDMTTLPPETPLTGEWDDEPGKQFSEGNNDMAIDHGPHAVGTGIGGRDEDVARAEALNDALRPLDRFVVPLASFLRLKTSVDVEPGKAEDRALLLLDQGKQATDPFLRRTLLVRAAQQLDIAVGQEAEQMLPARGEAGSPSPDVASTCRRQGEQKAKQPASAPQSAAAPSVKGEEPGPQGLESEDAIATSFAAQDADGSRDGGDAAEAPPPSTKRLARLWFALLELAWDQEQINPSIQQQKQRGGASNGRRGSSTLKDGGRSVELARKAAVAVLRSGPWSPDRNRELVVLQVRAQFILGETYVEELRLAETPTFPAGSGDVLDPRTMGVATTVCTPDVSSGVAELLDGLKKKACGCFVGGMRRAVRAKEPALVECGAVYVFNYHMPVWRKRLHHLTTPDLQGALEACVAALEAMDHPDTALLCSVYEGLARTLSSSSSATGVGGVGGGGAKAEELCLRAISTLDRPHNKPRGTAVGTGAGAGGGKSGGGAKGKSGGKKADAASGDKAGGDGGGGSAGARRANVSELKGLVEVRASSQVARAGAAAVTGEGRPLLQALALLTAASTLSATGPTPAVDDLVDKCTTVMREYRDTVAAAARTMAEAEERQKLRAAKTAKDRNNGDQGGGEAGAEEVVPAPAHGGGKGGGVGLSAGENVEVKLDVFAALSGRKGTTLEEDQSELELAAEIWCRLGKERMKRGAKRAAEECCGYVTELLPQSTAARRRMPPRLWRWLAVAEGLWGQAVASMVAPESQEKPLQDELRRVAMKHLALAAKFGTLACSPAVTLDAARRLWNVTLPLADTAAGRAISFSSLRAVLIQMAKGGVIDGGSVRAQLYVLLFECYSDRAEWKQGLAAASESLRCVPPEFQWRVVFMSRLGVTALDGLAKTKESDKVLQGKSFCTLARSASDPKQQLSAYLKALETLGERFERVDCLVEMGEWATGRGLVRYGCDYLRSALDLLYDVEEKAMAIQEGEEEEAQAERGKDKEGSDNGEPARPTGEASSRTSSTTGGGLRRAASKRSLHSSQGQRSSRGSSRGTKSSQASQGPASSSIEPDQEGFPETLGMGHLETAVRILAMLAKSGGGCSTFEERLDVLLQAHYFLGRMAKMVDETVAWGRRHRLYEDAVPEGVERNSTPFDEWWDVSREEDEQPLANGTGVPTNLREWAYWRPEDEVHRGIDDDDNDKDCGGGGDLHRYMASPPPGREAFAVNSTTIDKAPLLFHHLLDLADSMESHGLAAHAAAPLAVCELVARLCLSPTNEASGPAGKGKGATGAGGTSGAAAAPPTPSKAGKGNSGGDGGGGGESGAGGGDGQDAESKSPALTLACLRRSRLLLKLGPTCRKAALRAASAAGPLGISIEEAARRGAEVDRILRQREEDESFLPQTGFADRPFPTTTAAPAVSATTNKTTRNLSGMIGSASGGTSAAVGSSGGKEAARDAKFAAVPRLGKLEDRKLWALLAKEAVQLGECRAAAEYLRAAQRHNDAFHDRDNVISCLETQAALCETQGHPEQALPCLLRASALLRTPEAVGSNAARWGKITASVGTLMRKVGIADDKIRQSLEAACGALEGSIIREVEGVEAGATATPGAVSDHGQGQRTAPSQLLCTPATLPSVVVDLDAAVAFSGCVGLLADTCAATGATGDCASSSVASPAKATSTAGRDRTSTRTFTATNSTSTIGVVAPAASSTLSYKCGRAQAQHLLPRHREQDNSAMPPAVRVLSAAADKLRPLGNHPALSAVLRRTAREWVRQWAQQSTVPAAGTSVACLQNAVACLAEARAVLSVLATAAEPIAEVLASCPAGAREEQAKPTDGGDEEDNNHAAGAAEKKGGKGKGAAPKGGAKKAVATGGGASGAAADAVPEEGTAGEESAGKVPSAAVSTPLGRSLVMVQLEEACVRAMLGRKQGEGRSSKNAKEAAANAEGVTPVQRYMEASRPLGHPTPEEMEPPQLEQALALAEMARERCKLSYSSCTPSLLESGDENGTLSSGHTASMGLIPLALAWEGSALALLAARAGLSDEAWSPRPPPPRPATPSPATEAPPAKGGKSAGKGGKGANKGGKGAKGGGAVPGEGEAKKAPVSIPPMQEGFDLREQARWKLERAVEAALSAKRWDAAGVAAFALAELLGGDDSPTAAKALMLHQSCRARDRLLRLLRGALPQSSRYRLHIDRVTAAQGMLRGMHNLDAACNLFLAPPPVEADASVAGTAGEGSVSGVFDFPVAESSYDFLAAHLEGWRRLECDEESNSDALLNGIPEGLALLSLQVSPDGTTLYTAAYAAIPPPMEEATSNDGGEEASKHAAAMATAAVVWRYVMKPREMRALAELGLRMDVFQGSVKRHCLEKCDEEGKKGDYIAANNNSSSEGGLKNNDLASASSNNAGTATGSSSNNNSNSNSDLGTVTVPLSSTATFATAATPMVAECEEELDGIIAGMESLLSHIWGKDVVGGLAPFLDRCREEQLSLVLLMDESLEKLPVEASAALGGVPSVSRDISLHMLRHRLKAAAHAPTGQDVVSNAHMRYVADPLSEDPGVSPPPPDPAKVGKPAGGKAPKGKKGAAAGKKTNTATADPVEEGGRPSILKVLRELVGKGGGGSAAAGKGKGAAGNVRVSAWKGVGGDDHVPGVREWQTLIAGNEPPTATNSTTGGGFLYYGPVRCLAKLPPKHLAGLSANCKAAILIDRADNSASRRLESKQDTLKSREDIEAEAPAQTAALFSLIGCQSIVLNMWSVTLHNNRRIACSLFHGWGEEGLPLGGALAAVRVQRQLECIAKDAANLERALAGEGKYGSIDPAKATVANADEDRKILEERTVRTMRKRRKLELELKQLEQQQQQLDQAYPPPQHDAGPDSERETAAAATQDTSDEKKGDVKTNHGGGSSTFGGGETASGTGRTCDASLPADASASAPAEHQEATSISSDTIADVIQVTTLKTDAPKEKGRAKKRKQDSSTAVSPETMAKDGKEGPSYGGVAKQKATAFAVGSGRGGVGGPSETNDAAAGFHVDVDKLIDVCYSDADVSRYLLSEDLDWNRRKKRVSDQFDKYTVLCTPKHKPKVKLVWLGFGSDEQNGRDVLAAKVKEDLVSCFEM
eukprot:g13389.t1